MHKPRLCDSQNTPFWVCLNYTMRDTSRVGKIHSYYLVAFVFSFFLYSDAGRVGKRGSYYLVAFVFFPFLYPDAGRVAPIRACVWW